MRKRSSKPKLKVIQCVTPEERARKQKLLHAECASLGSGDIYVSYGFAPTGFDDVELQKLDAFSDATGGRFIDKGGVWLDIAGTTLISLEEVMGEVANGHTREYSGFKRGEVAGMIYFQFTDIVLEDDGLVQDTSYVDFGRFRLIVLDVIDKYIRPPLVLVKG
jgi:hypothetical protein